MLHLDSLNKTVLKLGLLFVLIISVQSCRKKILHEPSSVIGANNWAQVTVGYLWDIETVEVFNNQLYVGGRHVLGQGEVLRQTNGQFTDFLSGTMYDVPGTGSYNESIVLDLAVINNKLHIAGNFQYNEGVNATSFMTYDLNGTLEAIPLLSHNAEFITDVSEFNSDLIVCGIFGPSAGLSISANIDRIQAGVATGLESLQSSVLQATEFNNELYAVGDNIELQKWTGTTWVQEPYLGEVYTDEIYGIQVYNSELYLFGHFDNDILIKKLDSLGVWQEYDMVTTYTGFNIQGGMEVLDNELFAYGSYIRIDGVPTSNVIKLEGNEWVNIGAFQGNMIKDLTKFEEKLYLTTGSELYEISYP